MRLAVDGLVQFFVGLPELELPRVEFFCSPANVNGSIAYLFACGEAGRLATDALGTADAKDAERERRAEGLEKAPPLPTPDDLARLERAVRELRAGLAKLTAARADLRAATQRAQDAMQRAEEAENTASMTEVEVALRAKALAATVSNEIPKSVDNPAPSPGFSNYLTPAWGNHREARSDFHQ